ncbi:hypothetical protein L6164_032763 [Bauhinia variegata]|uniref:Uncharacterized protein n=1 Tax=Bauhinia variegata TaxID=167791 RepID=A0ACB9KPQ6_BAUVA|nr:hypothetical protein L6164_032763 [Bauhinia variegata]
MELINDLLVTASLAIVLSFLVAKLVSMAMGGRDSHSPTAGDVIFMEESLLRVQTHQSERKVQVTSPESVKAVDGFTERNVPACVENVEVEHHPESDHVGLPVKLSEEDMVSEEVSESQVGQIREEKMEEKERVEDRGNGETAAEPEKEEIAVVNERDGEEREVNLEFEGKRKVEEHGKRDTAAEPEIAAVNERDEEDKVKWGFEDKRKVEEHGNRETAAEPEKEEIDVVKGRDEEEKEVKLAFEEEDDDGWEGIERSELEKVFMAAAEFVAAGEKNERLASIGSDEQMELYGLRKLATEGPCREPRPTPFMLSARAKWNAWQKLGNMNPEVAMEQYITLLSDKVPGWMEDNSAGKDEEQLNKSEQFDSAAIDSSASLSHQQNLVVERELEQQSGAKNYSLLVESDLGNKVKNDDDVPASIL